MKTPVDTLLPRVLACHRCSLRSTCNSPVPGSGSLSASLMVVGEAPGETEDRTGKPFQGKAGKELDLYLEERAGLARGSVYVTNVVKCRPPENRDPEQAEKVMCAHYLRDELRMVLPKVVVAAGLHAARFFFPDYDPETMRGIPRVYTYPPDDVTVKCTLSTVVVPTHHPAFPLHDDTGRGLSMAMLQRDFELAGDIARGKGITTVRDRLVGKEEYYWGLDIADAVVAAKLGLVAVDTETEDGKFWCASVSWGAGIARVIRKDDANGMRLLKKLMEHCRVIFHNQLYDAPVLAAVGLRANRTEDTMVMAYNLGDLPQGLKPLSRRLLGMEMATYSEVVGEAAVALELDYIKRGAAADWSTPEAVRVWDGKKGEWREKKPQGIGVKFGRMVKAAAEGKTGLLSRIDNWEDTQRAEVEAVLGKLGSVPLDSVDREVMLHYAARDADATFRLYAVLRPLIDKRGLTKVSRLDTDVIRPIERIHESGMLIDFRRLRRLSTEHQMAMDNVEDWFASRFGREINLGSNPQIARVLYEDLGLRPIHYTKAGALSVDEDAVLDLKRGLKIGDEKLEVVERLLEYRKMAKRKSAFIDALPRLARETGRVHTTIRHTRTATGRLASAEPNLQTIPLRDGDAAKAVKAAFIAPPGSVLIAPDYSSIEIRVLAHESGDETMSRVLREGVDLHTFTASRIFGVPEAEVDKILHRLPAKTINFGIAYGMTADGLRGNLLAFKQPLDWPVEKCQQFIGEWYKLYPGVKVYQEAIVQQMRETGVVRDSLGRMRWMGHIHSAHEWVQSAAVREGINHPIQAGAQEIVKRAMVALEKAGVWEEYPTGRLLLQIHDQLLCEVDESEADSFMGAVKRVMESAGRLSVPTPVDAGMGRNWAECDYGSLEILRKGESGG